MELLLLVQRLQRRAVKTKQKIHIQKNEYKHGEMDLYSETKLTPSKDLPRILQQ